MVFAVDRFERARLQIKPSPRSSDTDTTNAPATLLGEGGGDTFSFSGLPWSGHAGYEDLATASPFPSVLPEDSSSDNSVGYPFDQKYPVTSGFGDRIHPITGRLTKHYGIDIAAPRGTSIGAIQGGKVSDVGKESGYGYYIELTHTDGSTSLYAHLQEKPDLQVGQQVKKGDIIGRVGSTGRSTGPHLHLEYRNPQGKLIDPQKILAQSNPERNRPIETLGTRTSATSEKPYQTGMASWYGPGFYGKRTANGEILKPGQLTAAHRTLPFGTRVRVTNLKTGQSTIVRINDRGPFHGNRIIDLAEKPAQEIGLISSGLGDVKLEVLS